MRLLLIIPLAVVSLFASAADDPTRVFDKPQVDQRTEMIRTLYQGSGFKPYTDKAAWMKRATYLRQQVLIAAGLWPMPEKCPLNAVIHGRIDRDDYTVEKVYFQSYPGFYVTGNLYRPKGKTGPFPGVLCPHGHWENGRLYQAPDNIVEAQIKGGWEKDPDAARYPLQARAANLARLGCVVFFYDMVGYADADPEHFPHHRTYTDIDSDLHGLSIFGLQTWDSIRSLDFLESLPDVDRKRLACTGASGGGTQTFILMTIDDRLTAAAPVCMISAGDHQGGCVCENMSLLRIGTDNVELAAAFAPRPFIHPTATGDWTKDFMEKGFPEIKATYKLFGAEDNFEAMRQTAGHNYNLHSREAVYNFFNKHLKLGHEGTIKEQKFTPVAPKDLSVWDAEHQRPANAVDAAGLKKWWVEMTAKQIEELKPHDAASLEHFRSIMRPALEHMLATSLPAGEDVIVQIVAESSKDGLTTQKLTLRRKGDVQAIPAIFFKPQNTSGITIWARPDPFGKLCSITRDGGPQASVMNVLAEHQAVLVPDVFDSGELHAAHPPATKPVEFLAGYNRTTLGNRVHDILTMVAWARSSQEHSVNLISFGPAGLLARALAGEAVDRALIHNDQDFNSVHHITDPQYVPGALRYGGIWPMAALGVPRRLIVHASDHQAPAWLRAAYEAAGAVDKLRIETESPKDWGKELMQ